MDANEREMAEACAKVMGWWRPEEYPGKCYWWHTTQRGKVMPLSDYHPWLDDAVSLKQADDVWRKLDEDGYGIEIPRKPLGMLFTAVIYKSVHSWSSQGEWWNSALCQAVVKMQKGTT